MKIPIIIAVALFTLLGIVLLVRKQFGIRPQQTAQKSPLYGLRMQALQCDPAQFGITDFTPKHGVWGVLMETGYPEGAVTLLALLDGTASLYFETGGGIIGGGQHENVRKAAVVMAPVADDFVSQCEQTQRFPLPPVDQVTFYILTKAGVFTATAPELDLGNNRHPLSPLFYAGHEVITQLRAITDKEPG